MKLKLLAIILVASLLIFTVPVSVVRAQDDETNNSSTNEQSETKHQERLDALKAKMEQRESKLQESQSRRCEILKTKLEFHRDRAAAIREHRAERYQNIVDRLNKLADKMDTNDLDTTELRAKIAELQTLVNTYSDSFAQYEADLAQAIAQSCDDNGQLVKDQVKVAREALVQLKSNANSIHTFFQDQLKPLLQEIKDAIKAAREAKQAETESTQNTNEETQ